MQMNQPATPPRRGFITLACGDDRYYKLAETMLLSYRLTTQSPMPFALLCDRENTYTKAFDQVVLLKNSTRTYVDKLQLLILAPYEETIFIDADCIAYGDLNRYWECFEGATDFSNFGWVYPMDSTRGWFTPDGAGAYADKLTYLLGFHGGIYYIRRGALCEQLYRTATDICAHYGDFRFSVFDKPADEPILALAMALHGCKPVEKQIWHYCWYPKATFQAVDFFRHQLSYTWAMQDEPLHTDHGLLLHFSNGRTIDPLYKIEAGKVHYLQAHGHAWGRVYGWCYALQARAIYRLRITSRRTKKRLRKLLKK